MAASTAVSRFDTGLVDITGTGGLLVEVNGRWTAPVIHWLDQRDQAWRESITHAAIDMSLTHAAIDMSLTHAAIDMSLTHAKAVQEALPHAQLIVDRFHFVKRANQMVEVVRRRTTWDSRDRRGRKADPPVAQPTSAAARRRTAHRGPTRPAGRR